MTPLDLHDYYDDNGNTPDFTELARIASIESEDNKSKSYPVLSFCLAQTYHSPGFDTPPATRPGEIYYEKQELCAMAVSREKASREYHEDIEEARQNAETTAARRRQNTAPKKRTDNFTLEQKFKSIRKDSPVYTPSPSPQLFCAFLSSKWVK